MDGQFKLLAEVVPPQPAKDGLPATGPTYRPIYAKDGVPPLEGISTCYDSFQASARKFPTRPCLGYRPIVDGKAQPYEYMTYHEVLNKASAAASGLSQLGVNTRERIGLCGQNCPEYAIALQACNISNFCSVALYDSLGESAIEYIVKHADVKAIVTSAVKLPALLKIAAHMKEIVTQGVIYWGDATVEIIDGFATAGVPLTSFERLIETGQQHSTPPSPPLPEDLTTIMYTSGTTGDPKGVMLTHASCIAHVASVLCFLSSCDETLDENDVYFSFLTVAHSFGRLVEEFILAKGASIGYWQGDPRKLMDDVKALQPTFFAGVPRVVERIYDGVQAKLKSASPLRRFLFSAFFNWKRFFMRLGYKAHEASWLGDKLVFEKIREAVVGHRIRLILAGGAPLSASVEEFMRVALCVPVLQGYGLTETFAASFIGLPHRIDHVGTVGPPMPITEFRLIEEEEMGYSPCNKPPRGQLAIRGAGLFNGYFRAEQQTADAMDKDGFFLTGDIGEIVLDGTLRIIDRKKNIFKLSQGEYVAAEKLESAYQSCLLVEQVWVYGNSFEAVLVAVVVPPHKQLMDWAAENGVQGTFEEVCSNPRAAGAVLSALSATCRSQKLKGFEAIRAVHLDSTPFSVDNNLITPSLKLKRPQLLRHYKPAIDKMYADFNAAQRAAGK